MSLINALTQGFTLTESQKKALDLSQNTLVEACAGSGKTSMLVYRFLEILWQNPHLEASQILTG